MNVFISLFSSQTGINWQLGSKYSNNKDMAGLSTRSKQYANFAAHEKHKKNVADQRMVSLVLREVLCLFWGRLLHCTRQWSTCAPKLNVLQRASYHRFITSASKLSIISMPFPLSISRLYGNVTRYPYLAKSMYSFDNTTINISFQRGYAWTHFMNIVKTWNQNYFIFQYTSVNKHWIISQTN